MSAWSTSGKPEREKANLFSTWEISSGTWIAWQPSRDQARYGTPALTEGGHDNGWQIANSHLRRIVAAVNDERSGWIKPLGRHDDIALLEWSFAHTVECNRYRFSLKENMTKRFADRYASQQQFTVLFLGHNRVDCSDEFNFLGAGCGFGYRSVHGASKVYPSGTKEPLRRGQTLWDVTVLHAYASRTNTGWGGSARLEHLDCTPWDWPPVLRAAEPRRTATAPRRGRFWPGFQKRRADEAPRRGLTPRSSRRSRTMACGGRRRAARHEPGGLDLGIAWAGNAILCPNQHEFADVDRRD